MLLLSLYLPNYIEQMLMLHDYVDYTNDTSFAKGFLKPHAWEVLQFSDKHYHLDNNGKMHLGPPQSLEKWQVALNPLPAWPKNWDVEFKLYAPRNTVVECRYKNGTIEHLKVMPESRQKDVILSE
jgi:hypothetical protein